MFSTAPIGLHSSVCDVTGRACYVSSDVSTCDVSGCDVSGHGERRAGGGSGSLVSRQVQVGVRSYDERRSGLALRQGATAWRPRDVCW